MFDEASVPHPKSGHVAGPMEGKIENGGRVIKRLNGQSSEIGDDNIGGRTRPLG